MSSKLVPHEKVILALLAKGRSYNSVALTLRDLGCETSSTNIFQYMRRRTKKIRSRYETLNPAKVCP